MNDQAFYVECRCGLSYPAHTIKKTRAFRCSECGFDLRTLVNVDITDSPTEES